MNLPISHLGRKVVRRLTARFRSKCDLPHCFSQEGEDMVLARIFETASTGFYVDVGAHHPIRFSNTYLFYLRGWAGINIDAMPGSMAPFRSLRPRDINLEIGISETEGLMEYFVFNEPALNTFSPELASSRDGVGGYTIIDRKSVRTAPLGFVLEEHLPAKQVIDFLSVDVEGLDMEVLKSNDWSRFRPKVILVEDFKTKFLDEALASPMATFLLSKGYRMIAKTAHTHLFGLETKF
jgi:FkbM family methyltransferase